MTEQCLIRDRLAGRFAGRLSTYLGTILWFFREYTGDARTGLRSFDRRSGCCGW